MAQRNLFPNHSRVKGTKPKHANQKRGTLILPDYRKWLSTTHIGEHHHFETCGRNQQIDFFILPMTSKEHREAHKDINRFIKQRGYVRLVMKCLKMFREWLTYCDRYDERTPVEVEHLRAMANAIEAFPVDAVGIVKEYSEEMRYLNEK